MKKALLILALALFSCGDGDTDSKKIPTDRDSGDVRNDGNNRNDMSRDSDRDSTSDVSSDVSDGRDGGADVGDIGSDFGDVGDVGDMGPPIGPVVICPDVVPNTGNTCQTTAGSATHTLLQGTVLAGDKIYQNGGVLIDRADGENSVIVCVGCGCGNEPGGAAATTIACSSGVISPGLINAHDHLTFSENAPADHGAERYEHRHDWRLGLSGHTKINATSGGNTSRIYGEVRGLFSGVTSVLGSGFGEGLLRNLDRPTTLGKVDLSTFPLGDSSGTLLTDCTYPNLPSVATRPYVGHFAEGINAEARNEFTCVSSALGVDILNPYTAIVHGIGLLTVDMERMATTGTKLVWSPRSDISLYGNTAQVIAMRNLGVITGLSTNWTVTGSMNMLRELACVDELNQTYFNSALSDFEIWQMATFGSAASLNKEQFFGRLAPGLIADISIFRSTHVDHRAVIEAVPEDVLLVMRGGNVLFGDDLVVNAITSGCDSFDLCGVQKRVCLNDAGLTFAALQTSVDATAYPLFFCGAPPDEPTCEPSRQGEYGGIVAGDQDGDGVVDGADNCPAIFNPIRPIDLGVQADGDNDGVGDMCDDCPRDANPTCLPRIDDADGDTVFNVNDNCLFVANLNQLDDDNDGKGNLCDACPNFSNPGNALCPPMPTTIYDIKQGVVTGRVSLDDVWVTGVNSLGFFVQIASSDVDYINRFYSGLFVFASGFATFPVVGDSIDVAGTVGDFFGQVQILNVESIVINSSGNNIQSTLINDATTIGTTGISREQYEGVLVTIENVTVDSVNQGTSNFVVAGDLTVNDYFYTLSPLPIVGDSLDAITGVVRWDGINSSIEPRMATDYDIPAVIVPFDPGLIFVDEGTSQNVTVMLASPVASAKTITLTYGAGVSGPATVTVPINQTSVTFAVTGITANATPTTVMATAGMSSRSFSVRVYNDADTRTIESVTFDKSQITVGGTAVATVTLNVPAPSGGVSVSINASNGTAPSPLALSAGTISGTVVFTATVDGAGSLTAMLGASTQTETIVVGFLGLVLTEVLYDLPGGDNSLEWVEIVNLTGADINLAGYSIGWGGSDYTTGVDLVGTIGNGQCIVVGGPTSNVSNANPMFFQSIALAMQNSGSTADGVALFDLPTASITNATVPLDAVIYGSINSNNLIDETGFANGPDVGDAPAGMSIQRTGVNWVIASPSPNNCAF